MAFLLVGSVLQTEVIEKLSTPLQSADVPLRRLLLSGRWGVRSQRRHRSRNSRLLLKETDKLCPVAFV